ncbi:protease [human gut metagenome]|uniref:Protease n=1 Tax=human gut metagenome TaxID=408170 RepID=K1US46_9ZZZZ
MKKIELLSPAGDLERLKVTLLYGADAVYLGGKLYNLRANATNFSLEDLKEGCQFAHKLGKKVFLTLNIVFHNEDILGVNDYIRDVVEAGIDAFIVSDLAIIRYIKQHYPQVEVHLSTQASTMNYEAALFYKSMGVDRIVLARELSKDEIREIIDKASIDIEVFIHGAMCTCVSGRCSLSNYVTNRDANRGGCSQVCRFAFTTDDGSNFTMATKDLNMARYVSELIEMNVTSMKVEGRMRSLYYLATVIGAYRKIIDNYYNHTLTDEVLNKQEKILDRVANREVSTHYYLKEADASDQYYTGRVEISNQDYLGQVIDYDRYKCLLQIKERNYFKVGDKVTLFTPRDEMTFTVSKIYDDSYNLVDVARHPDNIYFIEIKIAFDVCAYSMLRKEIN